MNIIRSHNGHSDKVIVFDNNWTDNNQKAENCNTDKHNLYIGRSLNNHDLTIILNLFKPKLYLFLFQCRE